MARLAGWIVMAVAGCGDPIALEGESGTETSGGDVATGSGGADESDTGTPAEAPMVSACAYTPSEIVVEPAVAEPMSAWGERVPVGAIDGDVFLVDASLAVGLDDPRTWQLVRWSDAADEDVDVWSFEERAPLTVVRSPAGDELVVVAAMSSEVDGGVFRLLPDGALELVVELPYAGIEIDVTHPIAAYDEDLSVRAIESELGWEGRPARLRAGDDALAVLDFPTQLFAWRGDRFIGVRPVSGELPCDDPHCARPLAHLVLEEHDPESGETSTIADAICIAENRGDEQGTTLPEIRYMAGFAALDDGLLLSDGVALVHLTFTGERRVVAAVGARVVTAKVVGADVSFTTSGDDTTALYRVALAGGPVRELLTREHGPGQDTLEIAAATSDAVWIVHALDEPVLRVAL